MIKISLEIIIGIIGLVFTGITSIAGIKYLLSSWKIRKLAKQFKKKQVDRDYLQKIAVESSYKSSAREIIEDNPLNKMLNGIKSVFEGIESELSDLNRTLQRFNGYEGPKFPKDFVSEMTGKKENSNNK